MIVAAMKLVDVALRGPYVAVHDVCLLMNRWQDHPSNSLTENALGCIPCLRRVQVGGCMTRFRYDMMIVRLSSCG